MKGFEYQSQFMALYVMGRSQRVQITNYQWDLLKSERQRTTASPQDLIKGATCQVPQGLNASLISAWITGKIKEARPEYLQWVIKQYKNIPTTQPMRPITDKMRKALNEEFLRTGIGSTRLLSGAWGQIPHGLNASTINSWRSDSAKMARHEHWMFVSQEYARLSDQVNLGSKNLEKRNSSDRILLTSSHITLLKSERDRTGLGTISIMRHMLKPLPEGLTKNIIESWMRGSAKSAKAKHWECVINAYKALPDLK